MIETEDTNVTITNLQNDEEIITVTEYVIGITITANKKHGQSTHLK